MKYTIFDDMTEGRIHKLAGESDDDYMARILRTATRREADDPEQINTMMEPHFVNCSFRDQALSFRYTAEKWCLNPTGTLHGGIMASACDIAMGVLARVLDDGIRAATVELNVHYMGPVNPGTDYIVTARMKKNGKSLKFMECDVRSASDDKMLAGATGIFVRAPGSGSQNR